MNKLLFITISYVFILGFLMNCAGVGVSETQAVETQWVQRYAYSDPVSVSPSMYSVLLNNSYCRVINIVVRPGEQDNWHSHPEAAIYLVNDSEVTIFTPDYDPEVVSQSAGYCYFDKATNIHSIKNTGESIYRGIMVELKSNTSSNVSLGSSLANGPSENISIKLDNNKVRILELGLNPGEINGISESSRVATYFLTEANLKITNQGNNANSHLYSAGEVRFDNGPGSRTFENIGKKKIRSIQFELK